MEKTYSTEEDSHFDKIINAYWDALFCSAKRKKKKKKQFLFLLRGITLINVEVKIVIEWRENPTY